MTVLELIARIRSIFNETGTVSGFLSDNTNIYPYIDSAQSAIIDQLIALQRKKKLRDSFFEYESLKPIIAVVDIKIALDVKIYPFSDIPISDFKEPYDFQINMDGTGVLRPATLMSLAFLKWSEKNVFQAPILTRPAYAISSFKDIVISPAPTSDGFKNEFRYYAQPPKIEPPSGAIQPDISLAPECHEAMMYYALMLAYDQDKETTLAMKYQKLFEQEISILS